MSTPCNRAFALSLIACCCGLIAWVNKASDATLALLVPGSYIVPPIVAVNPRIAAMSLPIAPSAVSDWLAQYFRIYIPVESLGAGTLISVSNAMPLCKSIGDDCGQPIKTLFLSFGLDGLRVSGSHPNGISRESNRYREVRVSGTCAFGATLCASWAKCYGVDDLVDVREPTWSREFDSSVNRWISDSFPYKGSQSQKNAWCSHVFASGHHRDMPQFLSSAMGPAT